MKRVVLIFGIISGVISSALMLVTTYLCTKGIIDMDNGVVVGYSSMVLAFTLVFFGVRAHRENLGGTITFGKAFQVGILIALISCGFYVVTWEIVYFGDFMPGFWDQWTAHTLEKMRQEGATPAAIEAKRQEIAAFQKSYQNPLINAAFTFLEPFPVALVAALMSAAILRRKPDGSAPATALAA